jgi:hypothetical protein
MEFERRISTMSKEDEQTLVKMLEAAYQPEPTEQDLVACPSCGSRALVSGTTDIDYEPDWEHDDGEAYIVGGVLTVKLFPYHLKCRICGLELNGGDELTAAGIEQSWELEDVDPKDFELHPDW